MKEKEFWKSSVQSLVASKIIYSDTALHLCSKLSIDRTLSLRFVCPSFLLLLAHDALLSPVMMLNASCIWNDVASLSVSTAQILLFSVRTRHTLNRAVKGIWCRKMTGKVELLMLQTCFTLMLVFLFTLILHLSLNPDYSFLLARERMPIKGHIPLTDAPLFYPLFKKDSLFVFDDERACLPSSWSTFQSSSLCLLLSPPSILAILYIFLITLILLDESDSRFSFPPHLFFSVRLASNCILGSHVLTRSLTLSFCIRCFFEFSY